MFFRDDECLEPQQSGVTGVINARLSEDIDEEMNQVYQIFNSINQMGDKYVI